MTNPYEAHYVRPEPPPLVGDADSRSVDVRPLALLKEALDLMGEQYLLFVGICFVALFINGLAQNFLVGPMICGLYLCFDSRLNGHQTTFDRLFKGFDFFLQSFLVTLLMFGFAIALAMLLGVFFLVGIFSISAVTGAQEFTLLLLIGMVPLAIGFSMTTYLPFVFAFPLVVDRRMNAWDAVMASWSGASKNMFGILGMFLIYGLLAIVATVMCYIPFFFLAPLQIGAFFLLYRDVFPNAAPARVDGQNVYPE